jgi:hypothetical protein
MITDTYHNGRSQNAVAGIHSQPKIVGLCCCPHGHNGDGNESGSGGFHAVTPQCLSGERTANLSRAGSRSLPTGWLKINPTNGERENRLPAMTKIFIKGRNPPLFAKQVFDVARLDDAKRWCLRREYCGYKNKFRIPCCFYQR